MSLAASAERSVAVAPTDPKGTSTAHARGVSAVTPSLGATHYVADDLDFSTCSQTELAYLCDHRLFVRSRYPKLVLALVHHPRFTEWTATAPDVTFTTENDKVACVVAAVQKYCDATASSTATGTAASTVTGTGATVDLDDTTFWQELVDACWNYTPVPTEGLATNRGGTSTTGGLPDAADAAAVAAARAEVEHNALHRVHRTLRSYRYWDHRQTNHEPKRTGGTRRKARTVWID